MPAVNFHHGSPLMVDYTPGAAVSPADVVEVGGIPFVAHSKIEANKLGAVAARGGVYKGTADGAISAGAKVYWDSTNKKFTVTAAAGANNHFGWAAPNSSAAADGDTLIVIHAPDGSAI